MRRDPSWKLGERTAANPHGGSSQEGAYRSPLSWRHSDCYAGKCQKVRVPVCHVLYSVHNQAVCYNCVDTDMVAAAFSLGTLPKR